MRDTMSNDLAGAAYYAGLSSSPRDYDGPSLADCDDSPTEPCQCGECDWNDWNVCHHCGTGGYVESSSRSTVQVARKDHGFGIKAGDHYRRTVKFGYYRHGPRTLSVWKTKLDANGFAVWM